LRIVLPRNSADLLRWRVPLALAETAGDDLLFPFVQAAENFFDLIFSLHLGFSISTRSVRSSSVAVHPADCFGAVVIAYRWHRAGEVFMIAQLA
jgi:hypothetical protein